MIDEYWTWIFYGYHSDELTRRSGKPIVARCDGCCKYRILKYYDYGDLCLSCSMIGRKHSEDTKRKISVANTGVIFSDERKNNISKSLKGKHHSEETKQTMSKSRKGEGNGMYGKHHSDEARREISEANSGKNHPMYGKHRSEEIKRKLSEAKSGKNNPMYGKSPSEETRRRISESNTGQVRSDETKRKMSKSGSGKVISEEARRKTSATKQGIPYEEWTHFIDVSRSYITRPKNCIKINEWFAGAHAHHITPTIVVHIPSELHRHIQHNIQTGSNMGEINALAIQFINGGL